MHIGDYVSTDFDNCQIVNSLELEIEQRFTPKKQMSLLLSDSYMRLDWGKKAERVSDCGSFLEFYEVPGQNNSAVDSSYKLHRANFCRDRLCPMCSWRRTYKIFWQVSRIMDFLGDKYRYLFLTLTVRNCDAKDLHGLIDDLLIGWSRFIRRKPVKKVVEGFFRSLEVIRNNDRKSPFYGTFHPHFHVVLAVLPSYFNSNDYLPHDHWLYYWQQSMNDFSITQVHIRAVRNKKTGATYGRDLSSAVAEVAKYAVKSADYIFSGNDKLMDSIVFTLSNALYHRRLTSFGGVFDEAHKQLGLDDCEDGDLVHVDDQIREDVATMIIRYQWSAGVYKLVTKKRKSAF